MAHTRIAKTILEQLGGNRFVIMTGAKQFVASENSLTFRLPKAKLGINLVRIVLTPRDEYDVQFLKIRGTNVTQVVKAEGVYVENLRDVFTDNTGLHTSLS